MTNEEMEQKIQFTLTQHAENERLLAVILASQDRFEKNLSHHDDILQELRRRTDRLDVIIERLDQRDLQYQELFKTLTTELIKLNHYADHSNGRLERIETNIERLQEAQIKTDEQIRALAQSSLKLGPTKRARKSSKKKGTA